MSLIVGAAGAVLLTALAAPAAAQQLPSDLAGRLVAESLWAGGGTLRFVAADRETAAALRPRLGQHLDAVLGDRRDLALARSRVGAVDDFGID